MTSSPYRSSAREPGQRWGVTWWGGLFVRMFRRSRRCKCHGRKNPKGFLGLYKARVGEEASWCPRADMTRLWLPWESSE